ncbi:MAG: hypothetical protein ACUZ8E_07225 [Candidatus Anammoxibacter sp.]
MDFKSTILNLTKNLYPRGRAFRTVFGGIKEKLHKALAVSEDQAYNEALDILDSILPDNDNFTEDFATKWERRLGLITNVLTPLADRKLAIFRKINHPGTIKARQHFLYLQGQLRNAGFDVFVHENRFPDGFGGFETKTPDEIIGVSGQAVHSPLIQHGQIQHGTSFAKKIANSIEQSIDDLFDIGSNYRFTFFISAAVLGDFATIPGSREREFRQMVLRIKPVHTIAFLFLNFTFSGFTKITSGTGDTKITSDTEDVKITS